MSSGKVFSLSITLEESSVSLVGGSEVLGVTRILLGGDASREVIWLAVLEFVGDFPGEEGKWSTKHRLSSSPATKVSHCLFKV